MFFDNSSKTPCTLSSASFSRLFSNIVLASIARFIIYPMSDPHQATPSSVNSLLETLLADDEQQQQYESSTLDIMVDKGTRWMEWDTVVDYTSMEKAQTKPPSSDSRGCWIGDVEQPPMRKKRNFKQTKLTGWRDDHVEEDHAQLTPCPTIQAQAQARERQRGKNWEKAEEDILVDCKSKEMDWKSISECLQEHGYTRNHKHCADKWYALRKHYLEIHQWVVDNPTTDYWNRTSISTTEIERIRSVPPSFCQRWYLVFDAAENKEGRKKGLNGRSKPEGLITGGARSSEPSCSPREHPGCSSGVVHNKLEFLCSDGGEEPVLFCNRATTAPNYDSNFSIQVLVAEIYNLSRALTVKFAAEEEERCRNLAIKEKKLELKIQRFDYKRKRDEEQEKQKSSVAAAQCLNFAVKAYEL